MIEIILIYLFGAMWISDLVDPYADDPTKWSSICAIFWPLLGAVYMYWYIFKLITNRYPDE